MLRAMLRATLVLASAAIIAGCQAEDPLFDVSGTITYDGKPIPKGLIFFDPAAGTQGTQGFANIENGKYNTATPGQGKGIRGGSYNVRIGGFDGKEAAEAPFGQFLFPEHEFKKDFPAENQTFDYDVPNPKKTKSKG